MASPTRIQLNSISMTLLMKLIIYQSIVVRHVAADGQSGNTDGTFIVEFSKNFQRRHDSNAHEVFYRSAYLQGIQLTPRMNFSSPIFYGASFHTTDPENISALANHPDMAAVWPVVRHARATLRVESSGKSSAGQEFSGNLTNFPHVMTGIDKLHALGYDGRGVNIAMITSGVDYRNAALGGGFGPGYKIEGGYDLVGDSFDGSNTPIPDDDPMDCVGSGTMNAGVIGANSPYFQGAAPNASLLIFRVFGCQGDTTTDVLVSAALRAYESGAHMIFGETYGYLLWKNPAMTSVIRRIVAQGVIWIIGADSTDLQGPFNVEGPSSDVDVMSVGSVNNVVSPLLMFKGAFRLNGSNSIEFDYSSASSRLFNGTPNLPLYALSFSTSTPAEACAPLPSSTPSLANKIVLIRRGGCNFIQKVTNAHMYGAKYIAFYSDQRPVTAPADPKEVGTCMVSAEQGAQWIEYLKQGINVTLNFSNPSAYLRQTDNNITGGLMSSFSPWSPTHDLRAKPELSAPGYDLFTTSFSTGGNFVTGFGTAAAASLVTGVAALYKQAHGVNAHITPQQIRTMLATSTKPVPYYDGTNTYSLLAPVVQQGGGLINALQAVKSTTFIRPHTLALNDTANFKKNFEIIISNNGPRTATYHLSHTPAVTVYTLDNNSTLASTFPPEFSLQTATVRIQRRRIVVRRNSTAVVKVAFTRPTGLVAQRIPVYSGYIQIKSRTGDVFHVSYLGVATDMKRVIVTDFQNGFPYISTGSDLAAPALSTNNQTFQFPNQSVYIHWKLAMPSSIVRIDVLGSQNNIMVAGRKIVGSIAGFPKLRVDRDLNQPGSDPIPHTVSAWDGRLANNKTAPAGSYRLLYRSLKIFGKPENKNDYETWISPSFRIIY